MKKVPALLLVISFLLCFPGWAAAIDAGWVEKGADVGESGTMDSGATFNGTIGASIISASLPCEISFTMDPSKGLAGAESAGGDTGWDITVTTQDGVTRLVSTQITSPTEAKITNHSVVPIQLEIIGVGPLTYHVQDHPLTGEAQDIRLMDKLEAVLDGPASAPGNVILALRAAGETFATPLEFEQYAILPDADTVIPVTEVEAFGEKNLQVYGALTSDRYLGYFDLSVTPVLKISAKQAAAPDTQ